jgi:hypothetical protein
MRYSVCVIDNDIPAAGTAAQEAGIKDSELLNSSNLEFLLQKETWADEVIKNLLRSLIDAKENGSILPKWEVYGFTNPSFYVNAIEDGLFRSDIVVYDWEYPGGQAGSGTDSESLLKEILDKTFCLVFVFSKADKKEEIEAILAKPEFKAYEGRIDYRDKSVGGADQSAALLQKADEMYANNFSFKFASALRKKALQGVDKVLSDMGRASLNDVKNQIAVGDTGKKDFIDFIAERFRSVLAGSEVETLVDEIPEATPGTEPDRDLISKVWSYRLYFEPKANDDHVRCGDIVKVNDAYYFVVSADCDLGGFWKKNLGIINTVTLHELDQENATLKEMLTLCVEAKDIPGQVNNLLGKVGNLSEGPFALPFVPIDGSMRNFLAVPKDLQSFRIASFPTNWNELGYKQKSREPMKYAYWNGAERICSVSEPFRTPVVQHILGTIGGNGVPDYSDPMKKTLKTILDEFSTEKATGAAQQDEALAPAAIVPA